MQSHIKTHFFDSRLTLGSLTYTIWLESLWIGNKSCFNRYVIISIDSFGYQDKKFAMSIIKNIFLYHQQQSTSLCNHKYSLELKYYHTPHKFKNLWLSLHCRSPFPYLYFFLRQTPSCPFCSTEEMTNLNICLCCGSPTIVDPFF